MELQTNIYLNQTISCAGEDVTFKGNIATVSDELGSKILEGKYANIYPKGDLPGLQKATINEEEYKKLEEKNLREIERLQNIVVSKDMEIAKCKNETKIWKEELDKQLVEIEVLKVEIKTLKEVQSNTPVEVVDEKEDEVSNEIKEAIEQIKGLKLDELKEQCEALGIKHSGKNKAELTDLLISELKK